MRACLGGLHIWIILTATPLDCRIYLLTFILMANYPSSIYNPRARANRSGVVYDGTDATRIFAEDVDDIENEIIAVETELGANPKGSHDSVGDRIGDLEADAFLKSVGSPYRDAEAKLINAIYGIVTPTNIIGLWVFDAVSGTSITDRGTLGHNLTITPDISGLAFGHEGLAPVIPLAGAAQKWNAGNHNDFSFGNGSADIAFSITTLCIVNNAVLRDICSKYDVTTGATKREFRFFLDSSKQPFFRLYDQSSGGYISRYCLGHAITEGVPTTLCATYAGNSLATGMKIFHNGVRVDTNTDISGSYTAIENTAALLQSCTVNAAGADATGFSGRQMLLLICKEELSSVQVKRLDILLKGYANLSL